jgi:hypothetical protein
MEIEGCTDLLLNRRQCRGTVMRFKFPATRGSLILLLFEFQHMNLIGSRKGTHEMETEACRDRPKKAGAKGAPV